MLTPRSLRRGALAAAFATAAPVFAADTAHPPPPTTVAILLYDGVQIIDYSGPWEVFGQAGYQVFTVAARADPVVTVFGQKVIPAYTFATAPQADVLLIPGGNVGADLIDNPPLTKWIQANAQGARVVESVCTGAFLLAHAGLLDGLSATTYHNSLARLAQLAPRTKIVSDQRFVDNGKIIVTAGLSSGIDGALRVVTKLSGLGAAQGVALNLEYAWNPHSTYARAALADKYLGFLEDKMPQTYLRRDGDRNRWVDQWTVAEIGSLKEELARVNDLLAANRQWNPLDPTPPSPAPPTQSRWAFADEAGRPWTAIVHVELAAMGGQIAVTVEVSRDNAADRGSHPASDTARRGWNLLLE
jgi:putative intracellular protease/amidase